MSDATDDIADEDDSGSGRDHANQVDDELEILKIAFGESVRKLEVASSAADTIRSRAGTVLAAATAVGAFLGGLAFDRSPQDWEWVLALLGVGAYLGCMGFCLLVLIPKFDAWDVGQNAEKLANAAKGEDLRKVYRRTAINYQASLKKNMGLIKEMATHFCWAVGFMVAELILLLWLLAATAGHAESPTGT